MHKSTPKIIIILTSLVFIGYVALTLLNYMQNTGAAASSAEEVDEEIKTGLQENVLDREHLQLEFTVGMNNAIDTSQDNSVLPHDLVLSSYDHYLVSMIRENQTLKVEHLSTEYIYNCANEYKDDERNYTDTYTDRIYYIQITDDNVSYYYPDENGNYDVKIFDDANFTNAFSALVFPDDLSMFMREGTLPLFATIDESKIETKYHGSYDNISQPLYTPFAILNADDPQSLNSVIRSSYTIFDYIDDVTISPDLLKMELRFLDMENFFAYAYKTWNDKPYKNDLIENGYPYTQFFVLYFYYDFDAPIEFDLPAV